MQKIANLNNKFNIKIYKNLIEKFNNIENLYNKSKNYEGFSKIIENEDIAQSIIKLLTEDNIKEEVNIKYNEFLEKNFKIITIEDKEYLLDLNESSNCFCIIASKNIFLNKSSIYIYYNEYFTKFAKNIISYFSKIISSQNCNVICDYQTNDLENIQVEILDWYNLNYVDYGNYIIFPNICAYYNYILNRIRFLIIIEARYEEKIVNLVDYFLENGKDIYVVPSNVFRKNSYFSNYLIKQGAEVILNKQDLKYLVNNIIC